MSPSPPPSPILCSGGSGGSRRTPRKRRMAGEWATPPTPPMQTMSPYQDAQRRTPPTPPTREHNGAQGIPPGYNGIPPRNHGIQPAGQRPSDLCDVCLSRFCFCPGPDVTGPPLLGPFREPSQTPPPTPADYARVQQMEDTDAQPTGNESFRRVAGARRRRIVEEAQPAPGSATDAHPRLMLRRCPFCGELTMLYERDPEYQPGGYKVCAVDIPPGFGCGYCNVPK